MNPRRDDPMSTPGTHACQDADRLRRYLAEELDESDEARIEQHLGECARCQRTLEEIAGAPEDWSEVREHLVDGVPTAPVPSGAEDELAELAHLCDPTDDPQMMGRIGGYEICGLVGRGTTGLVLKAYEPRLARYVAIKLLSPDFRKSGTARRRFEREARAIAAVSHDHVVPIHAVDEHRGLPFLVMKYVPGVSLEQRIEREGPLEPCEVVRIGLQVARALAAAHAQGVVHRDVKPANVLLEATVERALVTDFGLASVADEASMTRSGTISGTPHFMSPEQARGESVDARSDLFSLGSTLYAACTGRPPFRAENVYGVLQRVSSTRPRPVREINPHVPEWLAAFLEKLMEPGPDARFRSADEIAEILEAELAHMQSPTSASEPPRDWWPTGAAAGGSPARRVRRGLVGLAAGAAAALAWWTLQDSTDDPEPETAMAGLAFQETSGEDGVSWRRNRVDTEDGPADVLEEQRVQVFAAAGIETLTARVDRGDVELVAGEDAEIRVTSVRRVPAADRREAERLLAARPFGCAAEGAELRLDADLGRDGAPHTLERARFRVELPAHVAADVVARSGGVVVEGTAGAVDVLAVHGDVRLADTSGKAYLRTSGGDIVLARNTGEVYAQAAGGDVRLYGAEGDTAVHAEGGNVYALLLESPADRVHLGAAAGGVILELGAGVAATIATQGRLASELPFAPETGRDGTEWQVTHVGGGGEVVQVVSSSGELAVVQRAADAPGESVADRFGPDEHVVAGSRPGGSGPDGSGPGGDGPGGSGPAGSASGSGGPDGSGPAAGGLGGSGLSGSGLGGSGTAGQRRVLTERARAKLTDEPRPGCLATIVLPEPRGNVDGYSLYLPMSYDASDATYPLLVYLQGAYGVGGEVSNLNDWGMLRLLRDEHELDTERNRLLLDGFVVLAPHIVEGSYDAHPGVVAALVDEVLASTRTDPARVHLTGLSRGGHGSWGLASKLPGRFASIAPAGGNPEGRADLEALAGVSVWIAHNENDSVTAYGPARDAASALEQLYGEPFLNTSPVGVDASGYLDRRYVFTSAATGGHDSWTDLYSNAEYYAWLLRQRRATEREDV